MIALIFAVNPSVSLAADSLSLRLGHGSDMPLAYHSLPRRHFVTPCTGEPLGVPTGEKKFVFPNN
jgi:hypothetical protein